MKLRGNGRSLLFGMLMVLSLIPVWLTPYPPLQDYPDWLLQAQILRRFHDPNFKFAEYYSIVSIPLPNAGAVGLIYLLSFIVPIQLAGKLVLSLYLMSFPLSIVYFLRAVQHRPSAFEFLALVLTYNFFFHMGYLGYLFGLVLLFFLLGYLWLHWEQFSKANACLLSAGALLVLLMHPVPWAALMFIAASRAAIESRPADYRRHLRLAVAFLPSLILLGAYLASGSQKLILFPYPNLASKLGSYVEPLLFAFIPQPLPDFIPPILINAVVWFGLGALLIFAFKGARKNSFLEGKRLAQPTVLSIALWLFLLTLAMPGWISGLTRPDERLVIPIAVLAMGGIRWPSPDWRWDATCATVYIALLGLNTTVFIRAGHDINVLVNGLSSFVSPDQHPFFLPVPCQRSRTLAEQWTPIVDRTSRAGFYLTLEGGGNNRQVLDTRIVKVRNPLPPVQSVTVVAGLTDLENQLPDLKAAVLSEYTTIALIGCPESTHHVANLLSDSFAPVNPQSPSFAHLLMLQRRQDR